ncbi:unnamed protein product, partial [Rotaria sp. Silwood1]
MKLSLIRFGGGGDAEVPAHIREKMSTNWYIRHNQQLRMAEQEAERRPSKTSITDDKSFVTKKKTKA